MIKFEDDDSPNSSEETFMCIKLKMKSKLESAGKLI